MTSEQHGPKPVQGWVLRVIPLALLIILAMAGLRGSVGKPKWTGSHAADVTIGIVLLVVFAVLFGITQARQRAATRGATDDAERADSLGKLRSAIMLVLGLAMIADVIAILYGLHLKLPKGNGRQSPATAGGKPPTPKASPAGHFGSGGSFPLGDVLWGLLVVLIVVLAVLTLVWVSRQSRVLHRDDDYEIAEDSENLREAVASGRSALRSFDDAKSAIIACYVAMEGSLAERGAARTAADTPDELLARATQTQIVHGTAPARLTALFYEARFSSHPMDQSQRQAAEQALDELAQALDSQRAEPQEAGA
jgi:uncharacterized membrane protein